MSKKMMRRSLALGALMAFVITGSAMAAPNTNDYSTRVNPDGVKWDFTDNVINSGVDDYDDTPDDNGDYNVDENDCNGINVNMSGKDWIINSSDQIGISASFPNASITGGGKLQITSSDRGIHFRSSNNRIEVDSLIIKSGNFGIQASGNTSITARVIEIESGKASIYAGEANSNVTVSAGESLKVTGPVAVRANIGTEVIVGSQNDDQKADIIINGDIDTLDNGKVDVKLETKASVLNGKMNAYSDEYNDDPNRNLTLANGATWNVTGDSDVTTLSGDNGNIVVDMTKDEDGKEKIASVKISQKNATNTQVSGTGDVTDYLAANGKDAEEEFVKSVTSDGKAIDDTLTTEEGMTGGAYTLKINEDGSVEATQAVNTKSDAVSDAGMTLKGHWRAHMNDMNKRMGELRMANGEHGVWTRMVRGESEYQGAKMQYNQYQLGYDEKLSVDKRWTVGAAVTFSEGDSSYGSGSTDDKSTAFAIYGSKLNNDGTFVDLIARYARLESDLDDRNYGTGDYSTNGMSVSAEFGKRIQQGNGLWIEPQVELTYGSVDSADVAFSKNFKAHYDSMDSFIARAGFALGKDIKQGNVYARASYLYDFDGETEAQFEGGKAISEDFGGGWWEVGVGANINLSKATYIYADIEKTFGGEVDTNWQWNLGVRYSF